MENESLEHWSWSIPNTRGVLSRFRSRCHTTENELVLGVRGSGVNPAHLLLHLQEYPSNSIESGCVLAVASGGRDSLQGC